jgi:hypothetical protein
MFLQKNLSGFLLVLLSFVFLDGCTKGPLCDCFKSTGSDISQDRDVSTFSQIQVENKVDVVLTQDTLERIRVVGGKNLIDEVETTVAGGCLYIRNHSSCNFMRGYSKHMTVYVSVHNLNTLYFNGAGSVACTNTLHDSLFTVLATDGSGSVNLTVTAQYISASINTGPASIRISGTANEIYMYSAGNGVIHTDDIPCKEIHLHQHGTGDLYSASLPGSPSSLLDAELTSGGNVYCKGHPSILQNKQSGTGQLIFF